MVEMMYDKDNTLILDSGIQTVIPESYLAAMAEIGNASPVDRQQIYLDLDGAVASYCNRDLDITIDGIHVAESGFDDAAIAMFVAELNSRFDGEAVFTTSKPEDGSPFSTIYIGVTSSFDDYGSFLGIAETVDIGNKIHDDNAFVLLDSSADYDLVVSTISHEAGHLLGSVVHDGEGLERFTMSQYESGWYLYTELYAGDTLPLPGEDFFEVEPWSYLYVFYGGIASNVQVRNRGNLIVSNGGVARKVYLESGADLSVASGGLVSEVYCSAGAFMAVDGAAYSTIIYNGGDMWVGQPSMPSYTGTAYDTTVTQGGEMRLFYGTIAGTLNCCGGDIYVSGYINAKDADVAFKVSEMLSTETPRSNMGLVWDINRLYNSPHFTIDISGDVQSGTYILATGAYYFGSQNSISVKSNGTEKQIRIGEKVLGCTLSEVDAISLMVDMGNGRYNEYSFEDESGILVLTVENGAQVDFEFTEIEQPVFKGGSMSSKGKEIKIPFKFDATITVNKNTEGAYSFSTVVNGLEDVYLNSWFRINNGECTYFSTNDGVSYRATREETDDSYIYTFTDVSDFVLTELLPLEKIELEEKKGAIGSDGTVGMCDASLSGTTVFSKEYLIQSYSDAGKKEDCCIGDANFDIILSNGYRYQINLAKEANLSTNSWGDMKATVTKSYKTGSIYSLHLSYDKVNVTLDNERSDDGKIVFTINPGKINPDLEEYTLTLESQQGKLVHTSTMIDTIEVQQSIIGGGWEYKGNNVWAPMDVNACWIATAANMLYRAGYIDCSAQECYDILKEYYYKKDNNKSIAQSVQRVFRLICVQLGAIKEMWIENKLWTRVPEKQVPIQMKNFEGNDIIVGGILIYDKDIKNTVHVLSVYEISNLRDYGDMALYNYICADSDINVNLANENRDGAWGIFAGIREPDNTWRRINDLHLLLPNTEEKYILTKSDLMRIFYLEGISYGLYANNATGVSENNGVVSVSGEINDAVVQSEASLAVLGNATAHDVVVHEGGSCFMMKDSIIEGEIWTTGGEITVEAGADVSGARFNFALSSMEQTNDDVMLNGIGNLADAQIEVTVNNDQATGRYRLAASAESFAGEISLNGETHFDKMNDAGFEDGLLGVLTPGDEVRIEGKTYRLSQVDGELVMDVWRLVSGLAETDGMLSWDAGRDASQYVVEISNDGFEHSLRIALDALAVQAVAVPADDYQWRITAGEGYDWSTPLDFTCGSHSEPMVLSAETDNVAEFYFATVTGQWSNGYVAEHTGNGDWAGTGQTIRLGFRNAINDIFLGSDDSSILVLTDDANGDALFFDDIYSAFPEGSESQARIAKIDEIRAGAGDDIVDLTSCDFEFAGSGMTVRGGLGDDVIWANGGDNWLFGDAGNDRIVGASGNDVIVGGDGDDILHGGGGDDIFAFGGEWGDDTVEQLESGSALLWFDGVERDDMSLAADDHGNAVLSCGAGSVTLVGVRHDDVSEAFAAGGNQLLEGVTLRFGNNESEQYADMLSAGAFEGFTSEKVFEDKNKGLLA